MTLHERISEHLEAHLAGLMGGEELRASEASHWVSLLLMAEDHKTPVKRAQFFGFTFITRVAHIRETIDYLIYEA